MHRRIFRRALTTASHELNTSANAQTSASSISAHKQQAWIFCDSVFPIQLARWDLRRYIGFLREDSLLSSLRSQLSSQDLGIDVLELKTQHKDGGVFILVQYDDPSKTPEDLENIFANTSRKHPSWIGLQNGGTWVVRGKPWFEDMDRYASNTLKVSFDGPDIRERDLFQLLRKYGRIRDIGPPVAGPNGSLRSAVVTFEHTRGAAIAHNVLDGFILSDGDAAATKLRTAYESQVYGHAIRTWLTSHPKIVLPLLVFLLGTVTYTVFDPIRALMVKGKMLDWFNLKEFTIYRWLRTNTLERLTHTRVDSAQEQDGQVWKEREDAAEEIKNYLADTPTTVSFLHGPQGSGKFKLLQEALADSGRSTLVIDCKELQKAASDSQLTASLARQTGYRPVFTFFNSLSNLIDLASVGMIGQKVGMSSSLEDQINQILSVVTQALMGVTRTHMNSAKHEIQRQEIKHTIQEEREKRRDRIERGTYHDGRLDCVSGTGAITELGIGDEVLNEKDAVEPKVGASDNSEYGAAEKSEEFPTDRRPDRAQDTAELQSVQALPVVIIRNYEQKGNDALIQALGQWAVSLAESKIAHVVVISDNRENSKRLARASSSKPLNLIALYDADTESALAFVKKRLGSNDVDIASSSKQAEYINRLGGRASDLERMIHKVRSGLSVEEAVEDIIARGVGEIRKTAFGDDTDDAKAFPWSREQVWTILKSLSRKTEIPYHHVLLDFPFKGDDAALRELEHAELISVTTVNGRPFMIRPGKPVFRYVFERLAQDEVFSAIQDTHLNAAIISSAESTIRTCEEELTKLKDLHQAEESQKHWFSGRTVSSVRMEQLFERMAAAEHKIDDAERANLRLKKILARESSGGDTKEKRS